VFARTVAEAQEYATAFSAAGLATACVHAGTPEDERAHALAQFRSGRVRLLSNVYVMTEAWICRRPRFASWLVRSDRSAAISRWSGEYFDRRSARPRRR